MSRGLFAGSSLNIYKRKYFLSFNRFNKTHLSFAGFFLDLADKPRGVGGGLKQDYFALLGLQRSFDIDLVLLEKAYITNQQKYHPDTQQGINACEKLKLMQQSVLINEAYQILKDPLKRAAYMLNCLNKEERINDFDLLEEIFDLQEEVGTLSSEMEIKSFLEKIELDIQKTFVALAAMLFEHNMNAAKDLYFRAKYLSEIQKKIKL